MSDPHDTAAPDTGDHDSADSAHEGPIKTPKQLITAIAFSFLVPIMAIVLLVNYVDSGTKPGAGSTGLEAEAVAQRIHPVGSVEVRDAANPGVMRTGEQVYQGQCQACHAVGAAGAPKFGDPVAWGPRIGQGYEVLLNSALKGKNAMSAQGGGEYSDYEIGRAVVFMANKAGAKLVEPAPPAPAGAPVAPAADAAAPSAMPSTAAASAPK